MGRINQSFCLGCFKDKDRSDDQLFAAAAKIGYAAVEWWDRSKVPHDDLVALARKHGLRVASCSAHASLPDGMNKPANHDRIEKEILESIKVAKRDNIPGLICFSGNRNPGQSDEQGLEEVVKCFNRVKGAAEKANVNLNLELLNSKVNHPGYQCDHTAWGAEVIKRVGSPNVKLLYDIYHMQIMEGDIIRTVQENIQQIGHFHTAGNPGRRDMDDTQEMNYVGIMKGIAEKGYTFYVGHEFSPKGDKIQALEAAFKLCDV